ncbi:protein kinase [Micromonospora sp. NPDC050276]|uniref:protein kinase domain-containing protein n=1 Tax=Micromonospora sp. NPDC050276 TaxID=3364278 RepID=UPI00379A04FC
MSTKRVIRGQYEVGGVIGWGGTANVYLGRDIRSGSPVAIKVLRKDLARDPLFQSKFRREAQLLARLNHPAIVAIHDAGHEEVEVSSADTVPVPFIVMEYVAGRSLRDLLDIGRLELEESVHYQAGVLSALEFSHRAGIVHRDIKPANVMVTTEGAVKVVDFGIARASGDLAATLTLAHEVLGTPQYLSPEQVRGETADARSDLYSAGCLLYELLTGRPPFVGADPISVAYQHVYAEPARASTRRLGLSPCFDSVLKKALAKARKDRYQNARTFREALQSAAQGVVRDEDGSQAGAFEQRVPAESPWAAAPERPPLTADWPAGRRGRGSGQQQLFELLVGGDVELWK